MYATRTLGLSAILAAGCSTAGLSPTDGGGGPAATDLATPPPGADLATGPVPRACIPLNVAAARGTQRDYFEAVTGALEVAPVWREAPAWTGRVLNDRARRWGWTPTVDLAQALAEIVAGLSARP